MIRMWNVDRQEIQKYPLRFKVLVEFSATRKEKIYKERDKITRRDKIIKRERKNERATVSDNEEATARLD